MEIEENKLLDDTYKPNGSNIGGIVLARPATTKERLILDLYPFPTCGSLEYHIDNNYIEKVPEGLARQNVSENEWILFIKELNDVIRKNSLSKFSLILGFILVLPIPFILHRLTNLNKEVSRVIKNFNHLILQRRGLYAKTQVAVYSVMSYHEEISWLAISLTERDATFLKSQESVFEYNPCSNKMNAISVFLWKKYICCTPKVI